MRSVAILLIFSITALWFVSCAPLPPINEPGQTSTTKPNTDNSETSIVDAERDSIIAIRNSFGYERWKNGDYKAAREHFDVVRKYDVKHTKNIYRRWADCFNQEGMPDSAIYAFEEGIKYFPDDDYLHNALSIMYRNNRRFDEAIVQQEEAVRVKPDNDQYLRELADLYEQAGNWDKAIETVQKWVALKPEDQVVSNRLKDLIRTHRNPQEYLNALRESVAKFPDNAGHRYELARALADQGNNKEAAKEFEAYTSMKPEDVEGWRQLAHVRENLSDYNGGIEALKKVIDLQPKSMPDMVAIGKDYLTMEQWLNARIWAQKALAVDGSNGPAWLLMGDIYYKAADKYSGDSPKYDDKLVFTIAEGLFKKAAESNDPQASSDGDRMVKILTNLVPAKEERFMRKGVSRPGKAEYNWINAGWPEVSYIDTFLKKLD